MPKITAPTIAEHRARTYEALLDAVRSLVAEQGFEAVSMGDIARRAGVARTAIYNYAPDKATLLIAAASRGADDMRSSIDLVVDVPTLSAPERLGAMLRLLLLTLTTSTEQLLTIRAVHGHLERAQTDQAMAPFRTLVGARIADIVTAGIAEGTFVPTADLELTVTLVSGAFEAALERVIADSASGETIADATVEFVLRALSGTGVGSAS